MHKILLSLERPMGELRRLVAHKTVPMAVYSLYTAERKESPVEFCVVDRFIGDSWETAIPRRGPIRHPHASSKTGLQCNG